MVSEKISSITASLLPSVGKSLYNLRAGDTHSLWNHPALMAPETIEIHSTDLEPAFVIGLTHSGKGVGANLSPQLSWTGVPNATGQLLLVIEDTDVPLPRPIIHTVALLGPNHLALPTGGLAPATRELVFLPASFRRRGYQGPRPIPGHGAHHYGFNLFALANEVTSPDRIQSWRQLLEAVGGTVLARGRLVAVQER